MSFLRKFDSFKKDKNPVFSHTINVSSLNKFVAERFVKQYGQGLKDGVAVSMSAEPVLQLTITFNPAELDFAKCDIAFRQMLMNLNKETVLTLFDTGAILTKYEIFLRNNGLSSEHSPKVNKQGAQSRTPGNAY